jgi:hypothetical protein
MHSVLFVSQSLFLLSPLQSARLYGLILDAQSYGPRRTNWNWEDVQSTGGGFITMTDEL